MFLVMAVLAIACSRTSRTPFSQQSPAPQADNPPALPLPSPTLSPTPTLPPTPTPIPAARIVLGDDARQRGDWESALSQYQNASSTSQEADIQSASLLGSGRSHIASGNYQAGVDVLKTLIQNFPAAAHIPQAHFALAQAYSALEMHAEAAESYLNYLILRPGIIDAYVLNLRGDSLSAAGNSAEALIDYRAALQSPSYLNAQQIEIKIAQAHAAMGDHQTALGIYQEIYNRTQDDYVKAQMDYLMGQAYSALGQIDMANAAYLDAVNNFPTAYDSYLALLILVDSGVPVDDLNRGIVDYFAGQYGVAIAAFDRYYQAGGIETATARYYNGLALRDLGGFNDAIAQWDMLIQNFPDSRFWDRVWEQKAYTQWYHLNDFNLAVRTLLDFVAAAPTHPRAGEFLYDAADVSERAGLLDQAAALWERVAVEYPEYEKSQRALFLSGVTRYRLGEYPRALSLFQNQLANALALQDRAAALFWQAKAQNALSDTAAAQATWEMAANTDPTGYYSERARDILRQRSPFAPPEAFDVSSDVNSERQQAEDWLRTTFGLPPETDLSSIAPLSADPNLIRGTELWELGLQEDARIEFENLRQSIQNDPANSYRLANYLLDLGLYRTAIFSARQVLTLAGMGDAQTMSAPAYYNHVRFGPYYMDLILPAAQEYNFHPLFLLSVIRQESAFEGFVRSSAGARGLMQIIPATGQEIAASLNWPENYTAEDLYRPMVSIPFGVNYLAKWRDYFDGDYYAALAAYNGGPGNAIEWKERSNNDPDVFLEVIRFDETRNYIRSIYEIYSIYRRIYDRTP
jgi:soluble lytic murein transglycosylase